MKCKHRSATWSRWEDGAWVLVGHLSGPPLAEHGRFFKDRLVCDCGEWLPMGEANDGGEFAERIKIEKRAAAMAVQWAPCDLTTHAERDGWYCHRDGCEPNFDGVEGWSGWLAREIVQHDVEER